MDPTGAREKMRNHAINSKDNEQRALLFKASEDGNLEVVRLLVKNGAEVNARNTYGDSGLPLVQAVFFGHLKIAKTLIDFGADVNVNIHGESLVYYAGKKGYDDLVEHLIANGANSTKFRNSRKPESRFKKWRLKK